MDTRQFQEILKAVTGGQIQQILAAVLAIITALGGLGVVGSSSADGGSGSAFVNPVDDGEPAPTGNGVLLSSVPDSGEAVKGNVTVGGKKYPNSWSFGAWDTHEFQLNKNYRTLTATVGIVDGSPARPAEFRIGGNTFAVNKDNPTRDIRISVSDFNKLSATTYNLGDTRIALYNARLHK